MRQLRQIMEDKFRKELVRYCIDALWILTDFNDYQMSMDLSYQKEAFAALLESQKKAMFENAKLKDEVALQGVGIANLGARLTKQRIEYDACLEELKALYRKV